MPIGRWRPTVFAALVCVVATAGLRAQSPRPMGLVDLLNVPRLGDPQLSPDGGDVLFTRSDSDWKNGRRVTHIWRARTDGRQTVQLTYGADNETAPRWSPDGRTIAFVAKRGDNEFNQIYLLPADGGEARPLTMHASAVSEIAWTPDGSALFFSAPEPRTADEKARDKVKDDVYAYDENYKQTHLWKVVVASRAETRVTQGEFSVTSYRLSADGRKIVYHRAPTPLLGDGDRSEVWAANADGSAAVQLTNNSVGESDAAMSPDDAQVLFVSGANAKFETYYNGRLFVVPAGGGPSRVVVGEHEPYDVDHAMWSKDGKAIYFLANLGVHEELFMVPALGGTPRQLTDGAHSIGAWSMAGDRLALTMSDATSGGEVWVASVPSPNPSRVTHVFDYLTRDFALGRRKPYGGRAPTASPSRAC